MRSNKPLLITVAMALLLACTAIAQNSAETANPFHWSGTVAAGKTLAIKNVSGDVTVDAASGSQVEVTASKHGNEANRVRIQVVPSSEGVAICAIFPSGDGGAASTCEPGTQWNVHRNGGGDHTRVDFTVHIPRDVRLLVRDVNGGVKATGLGEVADLTTVNGSVDVSTEQWAHLSTVNGSVNGRFGRADWSEPLNISTVNGDITLDVPAGFTADVDFHTVNGSLETDLPLTIQSSSGHYGPKHITGTIGGGGRELRLHTVNGSVNLHKNTM
jgi:DUF4097 and DUF4098 domain-containing protein YvlB